MMYFKKGFVLLFVLFAILVNVQAQQSKKIVGYLPDYRFKVVNQIDFCKLTDLNICFANPDAAGNIIIRDTLPQILDYIRSKNTDLAIYLSLAGGALSPEQRTNWNKYIDNATNRPILIAKIVDFALLHQFTGIDIDLEWHDVTPGYSPFVLELKAALAAHQLKLTAALPAIYRYKHLSNEALQAFDYIHIMAYDEKGSWAPDKPGQHSSFQFAKKSIDFWTNKVGVSPEKLTLGLPFYAYNFTDPKKTTSLTFKQILARDSTLAYQDSFGLVYYNGKPTIEDKVCLASLDLAGVMIWELGQDTTAEHAMLHTVQQQLNAMRFKTTNAYCGLSASQIQAKKNAAFKQEVSIAVETNKLIISHVDIAKIKVSISNKRDKAMPIDIKLSKKNATISTEKLKKGTYTLTITRQNESFTQKLVKAKSVSKKRTF
jgi:chitinase